MALTRFTLFFMAAAAGGCTTMTTTTARPAGHRCPARPNYAEMQVDGTLIYHDRDSHGDTVLTYPPNHPTYADEVLYAGSPRPGERKDVPEYAGSVVMNADRDLFVMMNGDNDGNYNPRLPVVEPSDHRIRPGEEGYQALIDRVGGLEPGHFRGIPVAPENRCTPRRRR